MTPYGSTPISILQIFSKLFCKSVKRELFFFSQFSSWKPSLSFPKNFLALVISSAKSCKPMSMWKSACYRSAATLAICLSFIWQSNSLSELSFVKLSTCFSSFWIYVFCMCTSDLSDRYNFRSTWAYCSKFSYNSCIFIVSSLLCTSNLLIVSISVVFFSFNLSDSSVSSRTYSDRRSILIRIFFSF